MVGVALATGAKPTLRKVPAGARMHRIGGLVDRLARANLRSLVSQRIAELEGSPNLALATAASLLRYCSIVYLVKEILPAGRPVRYEAAEGEEIPSNPVDWNKGRTMEYAQCFYLPQCVALDPYGNLLVRSLSDAESSIAAMQRSFSIVSLAAAFAPYIVVDQEYQMKRYGLLGQLVNQGRALARHHMKNIIQTIQQRASANNLNRGLSLSVPYFDDQALEMKTYEMEVIPEGRIEFTPAFVVRAARQVQVRIAQNFGLSPSTRKHLIINLRVLENAFTRTR